MSPPQDPGQISKVEPTLNLTLNLTNNLGLKSAMEENHKKSHPCQWQGVRDHIQDWQELTSDKILLQAIRKGVKAPMNTFPHPHMPRGCPTSKELTETIGEYWTTGAIRKMDKEEEDRTKFWVPIFGREKKDSTKIRLITDLRRLNECHNVQQHHPQTWKQVVELIRDPQLTWGITLDLKGYYHHMALHPATKRWMRIWYNNQGWELQAMPFGWSLSPFWAHRLAKPIRERLSQWGIPHAWWVDDIMILGSSLEQTTARATQVIQLLTTLGIQINIEKSMAQPGFVL